MNPEGPEMENCPFEGYSFLVVDDNSHMRKLVKEVLHALGARKILMAEEGGEALAPAA
jgi:CheY-like chemotaxis protein